MEKEKTAGGGSLILIVDDVEANRFALRDMILEMGHRPVLTENGNQALQIMKRHRPQLIILDIAMPGMDGYELCRLLKNDADRRDIPIIFISAYDDPSDIVKGFSSGGEDYITKPFIPEVVKARVGLHLKLSETSGSLTELNRKLQAMIDEQLHQLELEKKNVLYALSRVVRETAGYDRIHMERLSKNCRVLAEAMQLSALYGAAVSDSFIETIELSAPLCDLGKIAVPDAVLEKEEPLLPEEEAAVQSHTLIGAEILKDIKENGDYNDYIQMSVDIVNYHHEKWDGSGYPEGRKGEEIPLPAQMVAIMNEYCTLTEEHGQEAACSAEEAAERIGQEAGVSFNPDICRILQKIYRQLR